MLNDLINGTDLYGDNHTRRKFKNAVATFKVDKRKTAKEFSFQHHHVQKLHGDRFLVCVVDPESGAALLLEDGLKQADAVVLSDAHPLKFTNMRLEAATQMKNHLLGLVTREVQTKMKKTGGKAKA